MLYVQNTVCVDAIKYAVFDNNFSAALVM